MIESNSSGLMKNYIHFLLSFVYSGQNQAATDFECNDPEWRSMTGWHWDKVHPPNPFSQS
jgi:hypothetical protein